MSFFLELGLSSPSPGSITLYVAALATSINLPRPRLNKLRAIFWEEKKYQQQQQKVNS